MTSSTFQVSICRRVQAEFGKKNTHSNAGISRKSCFFRRPGCSFGRGHFLASCTSVVLLPIRWCWSCMCVFPHALRRSSTHYLHPYCGPCSWSCASVVIVCHDLNPVAFQALWMNHLSFLSLQISPCYYYLFVTPLSRHRWHLLSASKNFVPSDGRLNHNQTKKHE